MNDKKKTSELIEQVNLIYPLPNLKHLRRVKNDGGRALHILLTTEGNHSISEVKTALKDLVELTDFFATQVPRHKPVTRAQYEAARVLWPTQFHEDKRLEKLLSGLLFSEEELLLMKKYMEMAFAERGSEMGRNGAVIVDPESGQVIARGSTCPAHPLKHAVMVCIDAVAKSQGGGAWNDNASSMRLGPDEYAPPTKKLKVGQNYLCTGCDVYVSVEPCIMCAMALLHSRIRRVFYAFSNSTGGGLGTKFKIHCQTGLNHHFEVFSGLH